MIVRREPPRDRAAVRAVHTAASRPPGGTGEVVEARLTYELREVAGSNGPPVRGAFRYAEPVRQL